MVYIPLSLLTVEDVRTRLATLERIVQETYKPAHPKPPRDWPTYEQTWHQRLVTATQALAPLVRQACDIHVTPRRGAPHQVALEHRVLILLLKTLFGKSNRVMAVLLEFFGLLCGITVSYKSVERLYSDAEISLALENLHQLILQERGVQTVDAAGDGTGYGLSITRHYASTVQRQRDKAKTNPPPPAGTQATPPKKIKRWVYAFRLLDLRTRLYVATGTSLRSERAAYEAALSYLERMGVRVASVRLDRLYSHPSDADNFPTAAFYVIPRKDIAHLPIRKSWVEAMRAFVEDTIAYLEQYYQRQASEAAFGADKRLLGWTLAQRRADRLDTAAKAHQSWHNLLYLGGSDHEVAGAPLGAPAAQAPQDIQAPAAAMAA